MSNSFDLTAFDKLDLKKDSDIEQAAQMCENAYKTTQPYIDRMTRVWDENVRFYEGDQYIYWSKQLNRFEEIPVTRFNEFVPRPITNFILQITNTIVAVMTKNKPTALAFTNSETHKDRNIATIAEATLDALWEINDEQEKQIDAALLALLCGTVFKKTYWDPSKGPVHPEIDQPIGEVAVDVYSPFEVIPDIKNGCWYIEAGVKTLSEIQTMFCQKGEGYTGRGKEVVAAENLSTAMTYVEKLKTATGGYTGGSTEAHTATDSAVLVQMYIKPTKKNPKGVHVIEAGGIPLYVGGYEFTDPSIEDSWHPFDKFVWHRNPLKCHGISLVENLIPLQKKLNAIDSLIILNRMTMVSPQWLIPKGCNPGYISGKPGLQITYKPRSAQGGMLRPERQNGIGLPADVHQERQNTKVEMHEIAMDNEVLGGNQPSGVNTASALNMLLEQTYSKFSPYTQRWEKFIEKSQARKLRIVQAKYKEPRPYLIQKMKELKSDISRMKMDAFIWGDVRDNVSIRIEAGSSLPRSKVIEQSRLMELAQMNMFGPLDPQQNPVGNQEFLTKFGVGKISNMVNADTIKAKEVIDYLYRFKKVQSEQEVMELMQSWPKVEIFDDLQVHLKVLTDEMKSANFEDIHGMPGFVEQSMDPMGRPIMQPVGVFEKRFLELQQKWMEQNAPTQAQAPPGGQANVSPQTVGASPVVGNEAGPQGSVLAPPPMA